MPAVHEFCGKYVQFYHSADEQPKSDNFNMHMHDSYEIYCFISGNARYIVEGTEYELDKGTIMLMRNSESHTLLLGGSERYERCTVNFRYELLGKLGFSSSLLQVFHDRALGKQNLYLPSDFTGFDPVSFFEKLCAEISVIPSEDTVCANLLSLLCALNCAFVKKREAQDTYPAPLPSANKDPVPRGKNDPMGNEILKYVNENLLSELSLSDISKHIHLSPSQINRIFKDTTGASVYHYVLLKRLLLAKEMIAQGENAGKAALSCGFRDYSSFFRSYKKHFGTSPTASSAD